MTECRHCHQTIHFDKAVVSERTGKMIPLQEGSDKPHACAEWKTQHRRYYSCRNCSEPIYFDEAHKSKNDKFIPLDKTTDEPHQCEEVKATIP